MFSSLIDRLFGCRHRRTTLPITPVKPSMLRPRQLEEDEGTYIVCLDCGKRIIYNWPEMRVEKRRRSAAAGSVKTPPPNSAAGT